MIAESLAKRGQVERFVRDAGGDAARGQRGTEFGAGELDAVERQQHTEHVPRLAVVELRARRQHAGGIGAPFAEIALDQRAAAGEKLG